MKAAEVLATAVANSFRSRVRAVLTILAIFVGAFTLTLTNGIGTGINNYISLQVNSFGADDTMVVSVAVSAEAGFGGQQAGPAVYDPDRAFVGGGPPGFQIEALTGADIDAIRSTPGIVSADPVRMVSADFIEWNGGTRYEFAVSTTPVGDNVLLRAGPGLSADASAVQLLLPASYVEPLGFASDEEAVGQTVLLGVTGPTGQQSLVEAEIAGVQEEALFSFGAVISQGLVDALHEAQTAGLPPAFADIHMMAVAYFDPAASRAEVDALKRALADQGYEGTTVEDQLGAVQTVINTIVGVLNAFAVIALIAAGFGIVNTLFMSVQERTREIGLMKAMGMGRGRIFGLFSAEAVFIGFLGSAIGSVAAIALGTAISSALASGPLSALAGLRVLAFDPVSVGLVILLVMALAFLAGTMPAARAAGLDPIDALRYE